MSGNGHDDVLSEVVFDILAPGCRVTMALLKRKQCSLDVEHDQRRTVPIEDVTRPLKDVFPGRQGIAQVAHRVARAPVGGVRSRCVVRSHASVLG